MPPSLEKSLTKKQILELYLNRIYLGSGAYGVDGAAHVYFGKSGARSDAAGSGDAGDADDARLRCSRRGAILPQAQARASHRAARNGEDGRHHPGTRPKTREPIPP